MKWVLPLLWIASMSVAADYYVDPQGDDARDGLSPQTAWKTLARIEKQELRGGDHLLLKSGVEHVGPLRLKQSGTRVDPIVISSYGGGGKLATIKGGDFCIDASVSHVRIDGIELAGATHRQRGAIMVWANRDLENIEIVGCRIVGNSGRGIWIAGDAGKNVTDVRIRNNFIHDNAGSGMQITRMAGGRIEKNQIRQNCKELVDQWQAGVRLWSDGVRDVVIANNYIRNGKHGQVSGMGVHVDEVGLNVVVKENVIVECVSAGIEVENCRQVEVINNVILDVHTGIFVYRAGHDHRIINNTVSADALGIVLQGHRANGVDAQEEILKDGLLMTGNRIEANIAIAKQWASLKINGGAERGKTLVRGNHFGDARMSMFQWGEQEFDTLAKFEAMAGDTKSLTGKLEMQQLEGPKVPYLPDSSAGAMR